MKNLVSKISFFKLQLVPLRNGKPVSNLKQMAEMVDKSKEQYLRFELDHDVLVVLHAKVGGCTRPGIQLTHSLKAPGCNP